MGIVQFGNLAELNHQHQNTLKILVVEDNPGDARLIDELLKEQTSHQFTLKHVQKLSQAQQSLLTDHYDAVLLDLLLPDSQRQETFLRIHGQSPEVPIVVLSGFYDESLATRTLQEGVQDYLVKGEITAETLTRSIFYAIERKRLEEKNKLHQKHIEALHEIGLAITSTLNFRSVLELLVNKIDLFLPFPSAICISLFNKEKKELEPVICRNISEEKWALVSREKKADPAQFVFFSRSLIKIENLFTDLRIQNREFYHQEGLVSYLGMPISAKGEDLGVLSLFTKEKHEFSEEDARFLVALATQAAIAIHNSELFQATKKQAEELEKASRVKSELFSFVSHELRSPIHLAVNYLQMMQQKKFGELTGEQESVLQKIKRALHHLLLMVKDMLQASRIEFDMVKAVSQTVRLTEFLDELKMDYDYPLGEGLTLVWDISSGLPVIQTDAEKLNHVLQNIINNAIKFTEKGTVKVSVRACEMDEEGKGVEFSVSDTGTGIPEDALPLIFEKFQQGENQAKNSGGAGLGLYIVKNFVELMGGKIQVHSHPGKGSTFSFIIPESIPSGDTVVQDRRIYKG